MNKLITTPHLSGRTVKLGRNKPVSLGHRMFFTKYRIKKIPLHADYCDWRKPAIDSLSQIYLNDQLGCCVVSAGYHVLGVLTGNAGKLYNASHKDIIHDYTAIGGYKPNDPSTDYGCDEVTALDYWCKKGFTNGVKGLGKLVVSHDNKEESHAAIYLFENLFIAMQMPNKWLEHTPEANGFKWDVAGESNPENGHAIMGLGYTADGILINSWGLIGTLTWAAVAKYCDPENGGSIYTMITPAQLKIGTDKAPNGIAWEQLLEDFKQLGGTTSPPS